jgi:hypothetical protein
MKGVIAICAFAVSANVFPQTNTTVVPFGFENQGGNSPSGIFFVSETQELFGGSYLSSSWSTPVEITGMAFRVRGAASFDAVIPSIQIRASTTLTTPQTLSPAYSLNRGSDEQLLYSHSSVTLFGAAGQAVNPFDIKFLFDQPFVYDPSKGNLLLDFQVVGPRPSGVSTLDAQVLPSVVGAPSAFILNGAAEPSGGSTIIQFMTVSVPEPATIAFLIGGGVFCFFYRRKI